MRRESKTRVRLGERMAHNLGQSLLQGIHRCAKIFRLLVSQSCGHTAPSPNPDVEKVWWEGVSDAVR